MKLRQDVNGVLEKARADKRIGKALEAHVSLSTEDAALKAADEQGIPQIGVAALLPQAKAILNHLYLDARKVEFYQLKDELLLQVLGTPLPPYSPPQAVYRTQEGDVVGVPLIKAR